MADTLARINLLTDLKATIEGATEDGTPGIATDYAHRLGWLSGGSFRWGALRGAAEEFASVKPLNIPTGYLVRTNATTGIMEASNLTDTGTAVSCAVDFKGIKNIIAGENGSPGGLFTDGDSSVWASVWWRLNGVNRFVQRYAAVSDWLEIVTRNDDGSQRAVVMKIPRATGGTTEIGTPLNVTGSVTCRTSEPVVSGLAASTSGLSYSNSTATTSIIAAGAKTIAAGRWGVAGTIWTALAMGTIQWTNAHTLRIQVKLGATVIADSGAISMSAIASGSIWSLTLYGTLRTVGASGTLQIDGVFRCTEAGGLVAIKGFPVGTASPAAIDTTIANTFDVVVTAGTASASNILATRTFHLSGV